MKLPRRWSRGLAALLMAATLSATPRAGWSLTGHDYMPDPAPGNEGDPDVPVTRASQALNFGKLRHDVPGDFLIVNIGPVPFVLLIRLPRFSPSSQPSRWTR